MALTWPFCRTCQDFHIFGRLSKAVRQRIPSPWTSCMLWRKRRMRPLAAHGSLAWAQFSFIYGQVILWHINTHVVYVYYIYICMFLYMHICLCHMCMYAYDFTYIYTSDIGIFHWCGQVIVVQFKSINVMLVFCDIWHLDVSPTTEECSGHFYSFVGVQQVLVPSLQRSEHDSCLGISAA